MTGVNLTKTKPMKKNQHSKLKNSFIICKYKKCLVNLTNKKKGVCCFSTKVYGAIPF